MEAPIIYGGCRSIVTVVKGFDALDDGRDERGGAGAILSIVRDTKTPSTRQR